MTFSEWFKLTFPGRETSLFTKAEMRRAWNAAVQECVKVIEQADKPPAALRVRQE